MRNRLFRSRKGKWCLRRAHLHRVEKGNHIRHWFFECTAVFRKQSLGVSFVEKLAVTERQYGWLCRTVRAGEPFLCQPELRPMLEEVFRQAETELIGDLLGVGDSYTMACLGYRETREDNPESARFIPDETREIPPVSPFAGQYKLTVRAISPEEGYPFPDFYTAIEIEQQIRKWLKEKS